MHRALTFHQQGHIYHSSCLHAQNENECIDNSDKLKLWAHSIIAEINIDLYAVPQWGNANFSIL